MMTTGESLADVAPYVGAWIETLTKRWYSSSSSVAPYVGAWIETETIHELITETTSHPTWVRGLKLHYSTESYLT